MEKSPLPKMISWFDIARGIGEVVVDFLKDKSHFLIDHIRYESPSEHFRGAAHDLDKQLYDNQTNNNTINRWDSLGDYHRDA